MTGRSEPHHGSAVRTVLGDVGSMLLLPAALAVTGVVVASLAGEWYALPGFASVAVGAGGAGLALRHASGPSTYSGSMRQAFATVALGWLLVAAVAAVPFLLAARAGAAVGADVGSAAALGDPWSALFEGMSGFTSTGLTMVDGESQLPHALQWWRSVLQWSGGAGVVVFVLAVIGDQDGGFELYDAEGRGRLLRDGVHATTRRIWHILLSLTAVSILALLAAGAQPWIALNHGLTGISTGGMVVTDNSFIGTSTPVRLVGIVVMLLGALSYGSFGLLLRGELSGWLRLTQVRALAVLLLTGGVAVVATLRTLGSDPAALDAAFLWVSALTTTGFSTAEVAALPAVTVLLLLGAMFVGGSAGSTSGGIKLSRAAWLGKALLRSPDLVAASAGAARRPWRMNGRELPDEQGTHTALAAAALAAAYLVTLVLGTLLLALSTHGTHSLRDVLFEAMSALNTAGLTSGVAAPELPWHAKAELMTLMWMGRLEVIAVAVLVGAPVVAGIRRVAGRHSRHGAG